MREDLKTISKIESQVHMYTPDQLRNALKIVIKIARDHINEAMLNAPKP